MMPRRYPPPPYPFQSRALAALQRNFDAGVKSQVLVSPTGSGKTVMAAWAMQAERFGGASDTGVVCISHRVSLNDQNAEILCPTFTPQSLLHGVPGDFGKPKLVIWEECHHSEAPSFKTVRQWFPKALMLGLTATPQRSDGLALDLFDEMVVAAHYSELLMNHVIVPCEVLVPEAFYEDQSPDLAKAYLDVREPTDRALFFCKSIDEADDVARRLKRVQAYHCGKPAKWNRQVLEAFRRGTLDALTTVDALGEGIDVPEANLLMLGRQCHNVSTYLQYCGRVLRSKPGKTKARVVDCVGAALRHGSPTEDRTYSIRGTGIQRRGGSGTSWDYDRALTERKEILPYHAKFRVLYGWQNATAADKQRQMGWLRQHAARAGYSEEVAAVCFETLFGQAPAIGTKGRAA
jgi:superfamily II DNA or RNA helicase